MNELSDLQLTQAIVRRNIRAVLREIGPMPQEALYIGTALDELPVLLNLHDPVPGSLLISGDPVTGKTTLLQTIATAAGLMHKRDDVQFGVITEYPEEWSGFEAISNNAGIFVPGKKAAEDFILSLTLWAHRNVPLGQSVLVLVDDLDAVKSKLSLDAEQNLRWLLLRGSTRRIWPIVTLTAHDADCLDQWLYFFKTQLFGCIHDPDDRKPLNAQSAPMADLQGGWQFLLREKESWLKFWIPTL